MAKDDTNPEIERMLREFNASLKPPKAAGAGFKPVLMAGVVLFGAPVAFITLAY
jgi:hypothetical protein